MSSSSLPLEPRLVDPTSHHVTGLPIPQPTAPLFPLPAEPGLVHSMTHHLTGLPIPQPAAPLFPISPEPSVVHSVTHHLTGLPIPQPAAPLFPLPAEPGVVLSMTHHLTGLPIPQPAEPIFSNDSPTLDLNLNSLHTSQELDSAMALWFSGNQYMDMGFLGLDATCQYIPPPFPRNSI